MSASSTDGFVRIEFGVVENLRKGYGWLPAVWTNGRTITPSWASNGVDRDAAISDAELEALDEARRYVGDWTITIGPR